MTGLIDTITHNVEALREIDAKRQIDIASAIMRIMQATDENTDESLRFQLMDRLRTCDVPRLRQYVTSPEVVGLLVASGPMATFDSAGRPVIGSPDARSKAPRGERSTSALRKDAAGTSDVATPDVVGGGLAPMYPDTSRDASFIDTAPMTSADNARYCGPDSVSTGGDYSGCDSGG
jgi:hypothetical protein